ncbi:MAG: hypothetical protein K2M75_07075 [Clostridia bacterium]|nr:hypothetical protein [Clostridia bacterium]
MKISKGRKITAWVTLSIMLVAVVAVTAGVLTNVPKTYQDNDVAMATTALNYTIDQASYGFDNVSIAYFTLDKNNGSDKGDLKVLYPKTIYIDKSENLTNAGYYFAYDGWSLTSATGDNQIWAFDHLFGYFNSGAPSGEAGAMHAVFDQYGSVKKVRLNDSGAETETLSDNPNYCASKSYGGTTNTTSLIYGRDVNIAVKVPIKGSVKSDYYPTANSNGGYTAKQSVFQLGCGRILAFNQYYSNGWKDCTGQAHFGDWLWGSKNGGPGTGVFHSIAPFKTENNDKVKINNVEYTKSNALYVNNYPYTNSSGQTVTQNEHGRIANDIRVNIYVYDKSKLDAAVKRFEDNVQLFKTLSGDNALADAAANYLTSRKKVLTDREVTQEQINTAAKELDDYDFQLTVPTTSEQSASRGSVTYNGSSRTPASSALGRFGTSSNKYFNIQYKLNGSTVTEMKNVGEYEVYAQPKTVDSMKFCWSGKNTDYKKIGTYTITSAQMAFKTGVLKSKVDYTYENNDFNVTVASALQSGWGTSLADNQFNNYYNSTDNPRQVYVKVDEAGKNPATGITWTGVTAGNTVALKNAGTYTVYYKITATNHSDITGSFTVEIAKASMSLKEGIIENKTFEFKNSAYTIDLNSALKADKTVEFEGYYSDGNPMTIVYVLDEAGKNVNDITWTDASSVSITNVGAYTVYYKASAANHNDFASSFDVTISKANIQLTVDTYSQYYGDTLLDSEGIIDNMLTKTAKVLNATAWADIKTYLKDICTFSVSGTTLADGYVKVGEYAIGYTKNTTWNDRIANITFTNDASKAYKVDPKSVSVQWTQKPNMYYNGEGGKRPSAAIVESDLLSGTSSSLSAVRISGPGKDSEGNSVALEKNEAIYAGTYEAYVTCTNENYAVDEDDMKCEFTILRRPITVVLQDRDRVYASKGTATAVWNKYTSTDLTNNKDDEVYSATIDTTIVKDGSGVLVDAATSVFNITNNATEDDYTSTTESERYFKVKTYALTLTLTNKNYVLTDASETTADFVINPAEIGCGIQSITSKVYNGQDQSIAMSNNSTNVTLQGYEATHRDGVKIQYKTSSEGAYADAVTRKDYGTTTVYYKITAPNHEALEGQYTASISRASISITLTTSNVTATYGDAVPTSAQLIEKLGITLNWTSESAKIADINSRIAFALANVTDRRANVGDYSLTHKYIGEEVGKTNFNITYVDECGIDVYTIEPKSLYVEWKQSGGNWAANGMDYSYDGTAPVFTPVAPDTLEDGTENVVVIDATNRDTITLAEIQLDDDIVGSYPVSTSLSNADNIKNYTIQNPTATFKIVKRVVNIYAKNQTAVYGRAKTVAFASTLVSDKLANAKWAYPADVTDANKFLGDDYSAYRLTSEAQSAPEGSYKDADKYSIELEIVDKNVAANYDAKIITDGAPEDRKAVFEITPAAIHFGASRFNIDFDEPTENNFVTKTQMKNTIDTTLKTSLDEFTVEMSDIFKDDDAQYSSIDNVPTANWVSTQTTDIGDDITKVGVYYVWVRITHHCAIHNHSNYETFETKVQVNILSGWASIKIVGKVEDAEYGNDVHNSKKIFKSLKDGGLTVYGGIKLDAVNYKPFTLDILEEYVNNDYVEFYVLNSDASKMKKNAAYGEYTIEINVKDNTQEFQNFRFLDEDAKANTDKPTTNTNAYVVGQRTIGMIWGQMDEVYGEHSETSYSHTYTLDNLLDGDDVGYTTEYSKFIDGNWVVVSHSETLAVGKYKVEIKTIDHPDYKLPTGGLYKEFTISKREVVIVLKDRELMYGNENAQKGTTIENYLNTRIQGFDRYTVDGKNADGTMQAGKYDFLAGDNVANIFRFKLGEYTLDSKYSYLFAGDYDITIENTSLNYDVKIKDAKLGKLTITKSTGMTYARDFITSKVYQGKEINVVDPIGNVFNYINLVGDEDKLLEGKDAKTIVEYKLKGEDDSKYDPEYKVKDAGDYTVIIKVDEPNHTVKEFEVTLSVAQAYVVINMTPTAEKEYGDTEQDVLDKEEDAEIDTFSKWLVKHCNITLTAYDKQGGAKITVENIKNDFEFKVVAKGNGNSTALEIGSYGVGTYRVYHRPNVEKDGKNVMDNYIVDYVEDAEADNGYCNSDAYKIIPKKVSEVVWTTTNHIDGVDNKFEFSNSRPSVTATYTLIGEESATTIPLKFTNANNEAVTSYGVGKYYATIDIDTDDSRYVKLANYDFDDVEAYEFEVVAKKVTVIIKNQSLEYGKTDTKVGEWDWSDQFTRVEAGTFVGNPVELYIDHKTDKKYYDVGEYHIAGKCVSSNYDIDFRGEDENGQAGNNHYAIFEVTPADMSVSYPRHSVPYDGKAFSVDVKSILAANEKYSLKGEGDVLWNSATVTYKQEDGSYTSDIAVINGLADGLVVEYKVQIANHNDYEGSITIDIIPAKIVVNIAKGATSVYGDSLLASDKLFEYATLDTEESSISVDIKSIMTLKVVTSGNVNKGNYNIGFTLKSGCEGLYEVELVGEESAYAVTAKTLTLSWVYAGAFEYDGTDKEISYTLDGIVGQDEVVVSDLTNYLFTDAGEYTATASRLNNGNYVLAQEAKLNWTINPKSVEIDWVAGDFTYNGSAHTLDTPTVKDNQLVGDDACDIKVTAEDAINAGEHIATAESLNGNYVISNNSFKFVIKQAGVSIDWKETQLTYNGKEQAPAAEVKAGLFGEDKCNVVVSGAQKNAGDKYTATATLDNSNYKIDGDATCEFKITAKAITFTWANTDTLKYTGEAQAPTAVAVGAEGDDEIEFVIEGAQVNAGTGYTATVTGVNNDNYIINEAQQTSMTTNYSIGKGTNEFVEFVAPDKNSDKLPWTGKDKPDAKWGDVTVKYYSDADCTQEVTDIDNAGEGTYWVKLTVAGTDNYDEISQVFEVVVEGGLNLIIIIVGAVVSLVLLVGAIAVVKSTNKKKHKGGAV